MRRTQAGQVETPVISLSDTQCRRCNAMGVSVIGLGSNWNGAIEVAWCSVKCAKRDGWPWLRGEKISDNHAFHFDFAISIQEQG